MKVVDEFKIEGFQNFQQYLKINPINIQITDPEIQNKLLFYAKRYKYRFIANSLLFSSSIKKDTNVIFITTNGLNDAKNILINGKLYQGIGIIFTSEIDSWEKIKTKSHWTNVLLTDSIYPIATKHFAFGFETRNLHNLLNFEFSLLDEEGIFIQFKTGEDKIPALNFTIQIINLKMLKVNKRPVYSPKKITSMRQKLMKLKVQLKKCFLQIKTIKKV